MNTKPMSDFLIYLKFEPYLAPWFTHEMGGTSPVEIPRGSAESDILQLFLTKQPEDVPDECREDANLIIAIPYFKRKDPRIYNYLPPKAVECLHKCIKNRFDVQLWNDLHQVHPKSKMLKELIEAWMECHGIEFDDTNWCTISKRYQRKREIYLKKKTKKMTSTSE